MRVFCRFAVLLCILSPSQTLAAPEVLPLDAEKLLRAQLESVPPFPAELVLEGKSEHWQSIVHQGEVVVAIYAAAPALLDISSPFPYDEFVLVLDGEVTLTHVDGDKATYMPWPGAESVPTGTTPWTSSTTSWSWAEGSAVWLPRTSTGNAPATMRRS